MFASVFPRVIPQDATPFGGEDIRDPAQRVREALELFVCCASSFRWYPALAGAKGRRLGQDVGVDGDTGVIGPGFDMGLRPCVSPDCLDSLELIEDLRLPCARA